MLQLRRSHSKSHLKLHLVSIMCLAKDVPNEEGEDTPEFQEYEPIIDEEPKVEPLHEADDMEVETLDKYIYCSCMPPSRGQDVLRYSQKEKARP